MQSLMPNSNTRSFMLGCIATALVLPTLCLARPPTRVVVKDAWLRSPPHGHLTTLGFLTLNANEEMRLLSIKTAFAKAVSLQLMSRENDVVRMDPVESVPIKAGVPLVFKMGPGKYFMQLKQIRPGLEHVTVVPMTAIVESVETGAKQAVRFNAKVMKFPGNHSDAHGEH
jgi:copper(I)-binding protein